MTAPSTTSRSHFSPAVNLSGLAPADQASALPDPGEGRGYRDSADEPVARVGDGNAADEKPPAAEIPAEVALVPVRLAHNRQF
jgi:hypothetical protein